MQLLPRVKVGNHPITKGLCFSSFLPNPELITKGIITPDASGDLLGVTPHGKAGFVNNITGEGARYPWQESLLSITNQCTIIVWANITSMAGYAHLVCIPYSTSAWADPYVCLNLGRDNASDQLLFDRAVGSHVSVSSGAGMISVSDGFACYGATLAADGAVTFYKNGVFHSSGSMSNANNVWVKNPICIGGRGPVGGGEGTVGNYVQAHILNRCLSAKEMALAYARPMIWLENEKRRTLFRVPSGGGGGISIPVVQGYRRMMQMR